MKLSPLIEKLKPSATIAAAAKAKALKQQGVKVFEFTLGEPDFVTPAHIMDAARNAMEHGHTHYTPAAGIPELRLAVCQRYEMDYGLKFQPEQVVVSNGAKHSIHNVLTAMCAPGDEVIIPAPYWVSYSALVELTGATPVILPTTEESRFCLSAAQFESAITPRTRLLMLNNPCNPTGTAYPVETLEKLARVAVKRDVFVLSDEIYEKLIYDGSQFKSFATFGNDVAARTIIVSGVSKAYAMTGWRIGWMIGPAALAGGITKLQSQQTSNPCSISQHASVAALLGPQDCVEAMRVEFAKRRAFVIKQLRAIPDVSLAEPGGAFYAFLNISRYLNRTLAGGRRASNSTDFCEALLEQAHVALVAGDDFGAPGYARLSFATSMDVLERGLEALRRFLVP